MFSLSDVYRALEMDFGFGDDLEFTGASVDSREIKPSNAFFALRGQRFDGNDFIADAIDKGVRLVVCERHLTPPEGVALITVDDSLAALQKLAAFVRIKRSYDIVSVTGSVGKTLTKDMISHVLSRRFSLTKSRKSFNNDYGVPLTLLSARKPDTHLVVETGANHLGEIDKLCGIIKPNMGVITNVGSAHIGEFGSLKNTLTAKTEMLGHIRENGKVFFYGDDESLRARVLGNAAGIGTVSVGFEQNNDVFIRNAVSYGDRLRGEVVVFGSAHGFELGFIGKHYLIAFAFAIAVANAYGIDAKTAISFMDTFTTPEGRFNVTRLTDNLTVIDDTYNASPEAMINAIQSLEYFKGANIIAVLGEMKELGDYSAAFHEKVGHTIDGNVNALIFYGTNAKIIAESAIANGYDPDSVFRAETIGDVNRIIREHGLLKDNTGNIILLKAGRFVHMERACLEISGERVSCMKAECFKYVHCSKCEECFA